MKIVNFGSLNIDHVYSVDHFVRPGETLSTRQYRQFAGGKGANQSIALARAGAEVYHAGKIGQDGLWLRERLVESGVKTDYLQVTDQPTGHAIIQVTPDGENSILLHPGANHAITPRDAERVLINFSPGDCLLLQNEISAVPDILRVASALGLRIIFNPAPMHPDVKSYPLKLVDILIINELEGRELAGELDPDAVLEGLNRQFPKAAKVLTLGARGVLFAEKKTRLRVPAVKVTAVDTTGAGDAFIGYFVAEICRRTGVEAALKLACKAAAICVTRPGATDSIPKRSELGRG